MIKSLLIVDDDITFGDVLGRSLARKGIISYVNRNIAEAIERLKQYHCSHALVDLKLAQESGLHLIPQLKAIAPEICIIVLTGYSSIQTAVEAIKLGANNYLCKPASLEEILNAFSIDNNYLKTTSVEEIEYPSVERLEWDYIQKVLTENNGNVSATARCLNMHRRTLQRKLQKRPAKS